MRHSPRLRCLNYLADKYARRRVTTPATEVLPRLVMVFARAVTSLSGVTRRVSRRWSRAPAQAKFARLRRDFGGSKVEAPPLPADETLLRCGSVSACTYRQGLSPLSWLSYSPWAFIGPTPSLVIGPVLLVAKQKLPTPAWLNEPHGTSTRIVQTSALWSEPPGWDFTASRPSHPF